MSGSPESDLRVQEDRDAAVGVADATILAKAFEDLCLKNVDMAGPAEISFVRKVKMHEFAQLSDPPRRDGTH